MTERRSSFALDLDDIDDEPVTRPSATEIDNISTLPVREAPPAKVPFDQVNIKARKPIIKRFKRMATDYRSQGRLLEMMMDHWERHNQS